MGFSPWGRRESDMTEQLTLSSFSLGWGWKVAGGGRCNPTPPSHSFWVLSPLKKDSLLVGQEWVFVADVSHFLGQLPCAFKVIPRRGLGRALIR